MNFSQGFGEIFAVPGLEALATGSQEAAKQRAADLFEPWSGAFRRRAPAAAER